MLLVSEDSIKKLLDVTFPPLHKSKSEDYSLLLKRSRNLGIHNISDLSKILSKYRNNALQFSRQEAEAALKNPKHFPRHVIIRFRAGVGLSHVGLAMKALEFEFPNKVRAIKAKTSETKELEHIPLSAFGPMPKICPHKQEFFYKYRSANRAIELLKNQEMLWSSPLEFEDRLDCQHPLRFGFGPEELREKLAKAVLDFITNAKKIDGDYNNLFYIALLAARSKYKLGDLQQDKIESFVSSLCEQNIQRLSIGNQSNRQIWKDNLPGMRILCVASKKNIHRLWNEYADNSRGACIEFNCSFAESNIFWCAREAEYTDEIPVVAYLDEWVSHLLGTRTLDLVRRYERFMYVKHTKYGFENEWRLARVYSQASGQLTHLQKFPPQIVSAIYLGSKISADNRGKIIDIVRQWYPWAKIQEQPGPF